MWQQSLIARLWKNRHTQTLLAECKMRHLVEGSWALLAHLHTSSPSDTAVLPFCKFWWINGFGQQLLMAIKITRWKLMRNFTVDELGWQHLHQLISLSTKETGYQMPLDMMQLRVFILTPMTHAKIKGRGTSRDQWKNLRYLLTRCNLWIIFGSWSEQSNYKRSFFWNSLKICILTG